MSNPSLVGFRNFAYSGAAPKADVKNKPWQGRPQDVIHMWQSLRPGTLDVEPIPKTHKGHRFSADGVRLTGRGEFINSVLARLKDLLPYDKQPGTSLDIEYRELPGKSNKIGAVKGQPRYVAYVHVLEKKPEPTKTPKLKK